MLAFIAARLLAAVPVVLALSLAVFVLLHIGPGDPARLLLGENVEPAALALTRADLGLDQPLPVQYGRWLAILAHGDLGRSIRTHQPVGDAILARLPVTIELGVLSMVVALAIGMPLGIVAALHRKFGTRRGEFELGCPGHRTAQLRPGSATHPQPFTVVRGATSKWLRTVAARPGPESQANGDAGAHVGCRTGRRNCANDAFELAGRTGSEYIKTANAKGLDRRRILLAHAVRNALLPVVTIVGLQVGALFGGAVLIETVFALPGVGRLIIDSIFARDFPVVQGAVLFLGALRIVCNLGVDIVSARLDPRVAYR